MVSTKNNLKIFFLKTETVKIFQMLKIVCIFKEEKFCVRWWFILLVARGQYNTLVAFALLIQQPRDQILAFPRLIDGATA